MNCYSRQVVTIAQLGPIQILGPSIPQHLDPLEEPQLEGLVQERELVTRELLPDGLDLVRVGLLQALEDGEEERVEDIEDFVVVLLDGHLQIEPGEFAQVSWERERARVSAVHEGHRPDGLKLTVSVRVLGSEDYEIIPQQKESACQASISPTRP